MKGRWAIPTFEYVCDNCDAMFEDILLDPEEVEKYRDSHPCIQCDSVARRVLSSTNFQFKGTPGQSGAHDLDYPTLDKAVGRSAAERWKVICENKEKRDKLRRQTGQHEITQSIDGKMSPTSPEKMKLREEAIKVFNATRSAAKSDDK